MVGVALSEKMTRLETGTGARWGSTRLNRVMLGCGLIQSWVCHHGEVRQGSQDRCLTGVTPEWRFWFPTSPQDRRGCREGWQTGI